MKNPLQLSDRTILVTGASSGIGRTTSKLLSELGARVVLVGRNEERLQQTRAELRSDNHVVESFDLSNPDLISEWFAGLVEKTGPLDAFVHCAGISSLVPLRALTTTHLETLMRINFYAAVSICREFCKKRMHKSESSIVFVTSVAGTLGVAARTAYSASKGALAAFARSAAIELAKQKIRVNCVSPAFVQTEMYDESLRGLTPEQLADLVAATHPLGLGTAEDVAHAISFLVADTGRWITGTVLTVDGGYSAQ
jgi:NAD(P)-dependent dehydrogenase (short-subunit alcohol dehydrogenase family)